MPVPDVTITDCGSIMLLRPDTPADRTMKRTRPTTLPLGSISSGTLRTEDLLGAFAGALQPLRLSRDERSRVAEAYRLLRADPELDDPTLRERAEWCVEYLQDALDNHCPPYCYFGAHEGDGAGALSGTVCKTFRQGVPSGTSARAAFARTPGTRSNRREQNP